MSAEQTVWKFRLHQGRHIVDLPEGAKPISVGWQYDDQRTMHIVLWAIIPDRNAKPIPRCFLWVGTGRPIIDTIIEHIGTVEDPVGYIWHIFEVEL